MAKDNYKWHQCKHCMSVVPVLIERRRDRASEGLISMDVFNKIK